MRKLFLITSVAFLVLFGLLQLLLYLNKPTPLDELRERVPTLPKLHLVGLDGMPYDPGDALPVVLIYFNTTCDHCQRQVEQLRVSLNRFEGISIVLMTAQSIEELQEFMSQIDFGGARVIPVQVLPEEVAEKFGVLSLPQIFVYDANRRLVGLFAGETDPRRIRATLL